MAVQSDTSRISYAGNNSTSTSYAVPFVFLENSHLKAIAKTSAGVESVVTLTNHTGAGDVNGGTVRTAVAIPATSTLVIYRDVPITQTTTYAEGGDFPAASHERALDKLTMLAQQNDRSTDRAIRVTEADGSRNDMVAAPNTLLGLDATNQPKALTLSEVKTYLALTGVTLDVDAGMKTFADAGERALAVPDFTGQLGTQRDTDEVYISAGTAAGNWSSFLAGDAPLVATGSTAGRSLKDRFADVVNVKDFGAVGDGVADDTAAIQAALAVSGGKTVELGNRVYKIASTLNVPSNVCLQNGVLNGATMANGDTLIEISGTLGLSTGMNTVSNEAGTIVVSDATGISANNYLYLESTTIFGEGATTNGELIKVKSVVGTTVTPYGRIYDDYLANQKFYKPSMANNVLLHNLRLIGGGNGAGHIAVSATLASNVIYSHCISEYFGDRHFQFLRCIDSKAVACTAMHSDTSTGLAYGFVVGNGCHNIAITGCTGSDMRHGVTIGAENGVDRNVTVSGCSFSDCTDSAIDAHPQSQYVVFDGNACGCGSTEATLDGLVCQGTDCVISNNVVQGFSRVGILIQPANVNSSFCDNAVCVGNSVLRPIGSSDVYGISYDNRSAGSFCRTTISSNIIRTTSSAGNGIWVEMSTAGNALTGLVINNNNVVTRRVGISVKTNGTKFVRCGSICGNSIESLANSTYDAISVVAATVNFIERVMISGNVIYGGRYGINNTNGGRIVATSNMIQNFATAALNGLTAGAQTQDALTDSSGGSAATTLAAITAPAANATTSLTDDMTAVRNAIASVASQLGKIKADVSTANNYAI